MSDFAKFIEPEHSEELDAELIHAASKCLDRFTTFFNACDTDGMDGELRFPHVMLSGAERLVWREAGHHPIDFFAKLRASGWDHTQYEAKEPVLVSRDKDESIEFGRRRSRSTYQTQSSRSLSGFAALGWHGKLQKKRNFRPQPTAAHLPAR